MLWTQIRTVSSILVYRYQRPYQRKATQYASCTLAVSSMSYLWSMLFSYILSIFISSVVSREPIRYQPPACRTTVHSQLSLVTRAICNCEHNTRNCLAVQWVLTAEGPGSTSGLGTKIPRTMQRHSTTQGRWGKWAFPPPHLLVLYSFPHRGILWLPLRDDSS